MVICFAVRKPSLVYALLVARIEKKEGGEILGSVFVRVRKQEHSDITAVVGLF